MSLRRKSSNGVPDYPRVISPSPTPSEREKQEYVGPTTRSRRKAPAQEALEEISDEESYSGAAELRRSRTRSRSPITVPRMTPKTSNLPIKEQDKVPNGSTNGAANGSANGSANGTKVASNGHLAPPQVAAASFWSWRDFSRSPSPLGLIPIHRQWRTFVHKHEVPRKVLHVSIGFFVVWLYTTGTQTSVVPPYLMGALIPITTVDWLRHRYASFNRFYVRVLGALMRESEYSGWNGVIFYLLGAWIVLYFFPKDVGVMSVLLLSWCDTAASTFGRLWGQYTPRLRRGKSLAGSLAAFLMGVATSYFFYGWLVPAIGPMPGDENFMFQGTLTLPQAVTEAIGLSDSVASISGSLALGVMGIFSGFVASASEVVDLFGWDDNLTIPVLSGIGMFGFLKLFG
ncbi:CTP-dependent diacylglycerol kinase 1 [Cladobotryum mycophilum]|uniref:CTP-dependent diacylglycerol kinase 1 n=1 Tax=Cladobotryum mycophilum TaxID=491253 RepID=A0ABR0SZU2_9HYPO